jgi:C-terminal processing protease CtpA/Prc
MDTWLSPDSPWPCRCGGADLWCSPAALVAMAFLVCTATVSHAQPLRDGAPEPLTLDADRRAAIIEGVAAEIRERYIFPDIAETMSKHIHKRAEAGAYNDITSLAEFTRRLTTDLVSASQNEHLEVLVYEDRNGGQQTAEQDRWDHYVEDMRYLNYGFTKLERLAGNVGCLELRQFVYPSIAGRTAVGAMSFLAGTDAVIIDLRQNDGGRDEMIQLILTYFFEAPVHLSTSDYRGRETQGQCWTLPYVPDPRMTDVPLFVLIGRHTYSAAEGFAYYTQALRRATLIGEKTVGAAHSTHSFFLPDLKIKLCIPVGGDISPVTGTDWEGTGVKPDIEVPGDQALRIAHAKALEVLLKSETAEPRRYALQWALDGIRAQCHPVSLAKAELERYEGTYGPRSIRLAGDRLVNQREGRTAFNLIPMGNHTFMLEGLDYFRIRFELSDSGRAARLVGLYEDGRQDSSDRTGS